MDLNENERSRLGVALNEASLLGVELDPEKGAVGVTFEVLTLPPEGPAPDDRRIQFVFHPVGRVVASLRKGAWNEVEAEIVPFEADALAEHVRSFGGQPIYGWDFFDAEERPEAAHWLEQLSLDWRFEGEQIGRAHHVTLFQEGHREGGASHLDLRIHFDRFAIFDSYGNVLSIDEFCGGGERWWQGFHNGDARTQGFGLAPIEDED